MIIKSGGITMHCQEFEAYGYILLFAKLLQFRKPLGD